MLTQTSSLGDQAPCLVEITRGDMVESRHRGAVAILDAAGRVRHAVGDIDRPIFARSAIKPLQALPLIESGAADRYGLSDVELALACASHHGQPAHVEAVTNWLDRIGLGPDDLECGAHLPTDVASSQALIRAGEAPSAVHNNCSGKHTGFLCTARCLGEATRGYIEAEHPVQRRIAKVLAEMTGLDLSRAPRGRDGCGIPVIGISLRGTARAFARMADPRDLPDERRAAATRLLDAMAAQPMMVDGTAGMAHAVMSVAGATIRLKPGAEGVFCAALPALGLGIALKIEDGAARAAQHAMATILDRLDCFDEAQRMALHPYLAPHIRNVAGVDVGLVRSAAALDFRLSSG
ncbi:MAG TPA: asparaginase [Aliidongia sp.]|nr:asparaginase [Aliidongia sp.]